MATSANARQAQAPISFASGIGAMLGDGVAGRCRFGGRRGGASGIRGVLRHTETVLLIAHVGHWALWVLYAIPIVIVLGSIAVSVARERRERRGER